MRQILKQAREAYNNGNGLTQKEIATTIGISERMYQQIETGKREGKGHIWDALEAFFDFTIPQRQLRENNTQPDYINSRKGGIAEAKALNKAAKKFDVTDVALDVADNGRIDDPVNRRNAQEYCEAIGAALV